MYLIVDNKKINIEPYNTFLKKFKGFMFTKPNKVIVFNKCNSIHTFFMLDEIDVIMLDKDLNILYTYNKLKKNRIILPKKNVYYVVEMPKNTTKKGIKVSN